MSRLFTVVRPALVGPVLIPTLLLTLVGCSSGATLPEPGPDAGSALCTALLTRLPKQVLDRQRTPLDVAGAAAWGDPAIVLRCGVPAPGPSGTCLLINGQEWVFTETKAAFRFVTHDRDPAVEVTIPTAVNRTTAPGALVDLEPAVKPLPETKAITCR
ncbi:MAG TPA: DUF3515 family protein [Kineosporiaceae bacterium]|nr:DUF3515 family protein [Kineosporiaceae bacterium]